MRFVIVDPFSSGQYLAPELTKRGHACVAVVSSERLAPVFYRGFDQTKYDRVFIGSQSLPAFAKYALRNSIDKIVAGSEPGVDLAQELSEKWRLSAHSSNTKTARRDKYHMHSAIARAGLRSIQQKLVSDRDEAKRWFETSGQKKCVIKPTRSAGTDGVQIVSSNKDIDNYFAIFANSCDLMGEPNRNFIIQEFIDGTEYILDSITIDGEHKFLTAWKCHKFKNDLHSIYDSLEIVDLASLDADVFQYAIDCLNALGYKNGPGHMELFVDENGPVLCEVGARIHGGGGPLLAKKSQGYNQIDATVDWLVSGSIRENLISRPKFQKSVEVYGIAKKAGRIQSPYRPLFPEKSEFKAVVPLGQPFKKTEDMMSSPTRLFLLHDDPELFVREYRNFRKWESLGYQ